MTEVRYHYMDWALPGIGPITQEEIAEAVNDEHWQRIRLSMKGISTYDKLETLSLYWSQIVEPEERKLRRIRIINYLNALKRGGQLSKEGYIQR